jgi:hypothetical protein
MQRDAPGGRGQPFRPCRAGMVWCTACLAALLAAAAALPARVRLVR